MRSTSESGGRPTPPTPVRELMADEAPAEPAPAEPPSGPGTEAEALQTGVRVVEVEGARWEVRAVGSTRSGTGRDTGAPLLFLRFRGDDRELEVIAVGKALDALPDELLEELLSRARPVAEAG